ncbi:hypothetical protein [Enterococcus faecalis]|uniref:hypothetical protein n=1 Tax=Enterococcus faecalis TaxID=1351 RepID=UPI003D6C5F48
MKQIRFKHLATLGVCCSLFSNSLAGVTAVAETMTIESSPTAASHEQTASTKESAETEVKETQATETSEAPTEEKQEEKETNEVEAEQGKEEAVGDKTPQQVIEESMKPELLNSEVTSKATKVYGFTSDKSQIAFIDEDTKTYIDPATIGMTSQIRSVVSGVTGEHGQVIGTESTNKLFKELTVPVRNFTATAGRTTYYGADEVMYTIPKFYGNMSSIPSSQYTGTVYSNPTYKYRIGATGALAPIGSPGSSAEDVQVVKQVDGRYRMQEYSMTTASDASLNKAAVYPVLYRGFVYLWETPASSYSLYVKPETPIYYYLTKRKVTESFKNQAGATIPPPPNFEEGRKTSITSNDFTYTQSGTLPKSYKGADGKTYFLKG